MGRPPQLSDSELVSLAVAQALLGHHSEARWLRYTRKHLLGMFPYLPQRAGYNKRLRSARFCVVGYHLGDETPSVPWAIAGAVVGAAVALAIRKHSPPRR